jgi:hypothetical protein
VWQDIIENEQKLLLTKPIELKRRQSEPYFPDVSAGRSTSRCEICRRTAIFGLGGEEEIGARFCELHKPAESVLVRRSICAHPGCHRMPSYGFDGPCWCFSHRVTGSKHIKSSLSQAKKKRSLSVGEGDDFSRTLPAWKCADANCEKNAVYGMPFHAPSYCVLHRQPGMIDCLRWSCYYPNCKLRPTHGFKHLEEGGKRDDVPIIRCCPRHKSESMVRLTATEML